MDSQLLTDANFVLDSCGRQVPPSNTNFVDIPAHIGYSRFMAGSTDPNFKGSEDIGGVMHKGRVSFFLRALTAQSLPRDTQGVYWRLRLPSGQYFQSELTSHACAFGFGSDRQSFTPEIEWKAGEKLFVDLNTTAAGPPPIAGYSVVMQFEGVYRFQIPGSGRVRNPLDANVARYFLNEPQNILAPEFRFGPGCPSETPAGAWDETFTYVTPVVDLPISGVPVSNTLLQIDADSDFIVREVWPYYPGVSPNGAVQGFGNVVARMRRGDGYAMSSGFLPVNSIQGPMFKELKIKASDTLSFDASVTDGGGASGSVISFGLYLMGVKRRKVTG